MKRFLRNTVLSAAVAATTLAALPANAGDHRRGRHEVTRQSDDSDAIIAGIVGIAIGAAVVGMLATPEPKGPANRNPYKNPSPDRDYFPPAPEPADVSYYDDGEIEPWTAAWYDYCEAKHRNFDPETGTYRKRGKTYFCVAG